MLIAARVARAVLNSGNNSLEPGTKMDSERNFSTSEENIQKEEDSQHASSQNVLERIEDLPPTFRTDIANKYEK